jgi:uncharacterized protein YcbX
MAYLARISIFPIKSLDGVSLDAIPVLPSGALVGDREFAIVDERGAFVNGKRTAKIHQLRSTFDLAARTVALRVEGKETAVTFHLDGDRDALARWLSEFFDLPVRLVQNVETGFPDDTTFPGPTVISAATLEATASWFPGLDVDQMRLRLRTNLEVEGVPAFWEDRLYAGVGEAIPFQVGSVTFEGTNPCQRCPVPTRDPSTGQPYPHFQKTLVANRRSTFPDWGTRSRFNHFYRMAANTQVSELGDNGILHVGDEISLL